MKEEISDCGMVEVVAADGVAMVMQIGSLTHIVFTRRQPELYEGAKVYRKVVVKVVVPSHLAKEIGQAIFRGELSPGATEYAGSGGTVVMQ